ncbi:xyloglucan galactosyltransferase XLT2-like [Zingiber officinale]|uniref:Exostosin GT47 domain-containing protein n=1 Tax=Zingiber officinale TaxID=94328 RepID=A0A8J5F3N4_ZINOF|nr:xyloglucan galactosyltransferase XLT2-like [Zingiber officinale]KAG6481677.1 hypothetical protein ZIOFF_058296 [Zingiber officinale]
MFPGSPIARPHDQLLNSPPKGTPQSTPPHSASASPQHPIKFPSAYSFPFCNRPALVLSLLALQLILLLSARLLPAPRLPGPHLHRFGYGSCSSSGYIYVYDLPPVFNSDILAECHHLNPWHSRCAALSNSGFGPRADDLAGVVPSTLLPSWYSTDQFTAEVIFHRRILGHRCRTTDPSVATAFYVPFYAGLAIAKHLWSTGSSSRDRDNDGALLLRWIKDQLPWQRSGGWDHFIVLGRITWDFRRSREGDWGGNFLYMPGMENVTRLLIERNPWDSKDVGIPYPTRFHPRTAGDVREWQRFVLSRNRSTLFGFAGALRAAVKDDFRGLLMRECTRAGSGQCRHVDCGSGRCGNRSAETMGLFLDSVFCLQPRGDSFTRRSMFDCMLAGTVPVLFWRRSAYVQYGWYLPPEGEWSVFIDRREVRSGAARVREVLEGIGEERARRMRERVVEMIPRLVYAAAEEGLGEGMQDAFDVAVDGVLRGFREQRRRRLGREEDRGV